DPKDGRLWLVYGSYFGYIRLVELDPKTGKRLNPNDQPRNLAINCEASDMIYHDGWYYLLATHGSCCRGADSGYNIRMGRAKKVRRNRFTDCAARHRRGLEELAHWQHRRPHGELPVPGAAEVGDYRRAQRWRLSRLAVFQDHDRGHRSRAGRFRRR